VGHVKEAGSRTGSAIPLSRNSIRRMCRVQNTRQSRLPPPEPVIGPSGHFGAIAKSTLGAPTDFGTIAKRALGAPKSVGAIAFTKKRVPGREFFYS
jgi:hypothetical protein